MRRPVAIADALILPQYSLNHCSDQYTILSLLKLPMRSISIFILYKYIILRLRHPSNHARIHCFESRLRSIRFFIPCAKSKYINRYFGFAFSIQSHNAY